MPFKTCKKCSNILPIEEFYAHKKMADGRLNECKTCKKALVSANYEKNRERFSEYEQKRAQLPERKAKVAEYGRRHRQNNPIKRAARVILNNHVRNGKIIRQPCSVCGDPKSQAHHDDYAKPLDVKWLCFKHHRELEHDQVVTVV
jgi:hypothetical protein